MKLRNAVQVLCVSLITSVCSTAVAQRDQPGNRGRAAAAFADVEFKQKDTIGRLLQLDVYLPSGLAPAKGHPAIIWIHGGAWQTGDKQPGLSYLLRSGYAIVPIRYRLSSEAIWPAQIEDCKAAIRFVRAHAKQYSIDPQRLAVAGSSAGGHLAAMVGMTGNDRQFDAGDNLDQSSAVRAVVDLYGPTNFIAMIGQPSQMDHASENSPESKLVGGAVEQKRDMVRSADPITYVDMADPAVLILHGTKDPLVPINQSELLRDALRQAGLQHELIPIEGAGHGGQQFNSPEIRQKIEQFLKSNLAEAEID